MPKKRSYQEILKENLAEFDTTKTVDVKGPMLDPILGYEGDGELPTYKDAASVLERYYFGEKTKEQEISEVDHADDLDAEGNDKGDSKDKNMKHTEGPEGEEQAGTSVAKDTPGSAKEKEKDIVKEEEVSEKEMNHADLKSGSMKDTEGPGEEEQAGTGDTYKDFKKRVVESIEEIVENAEPVSEQDEEEEEEKEEKKEDNGDDKDEKCEGCGKEKCECKKEEVKEGEELEEKMIKGITDGPAKKSEMGDETKGPDGSYHKDSAKIGQTKEVQNGAFDENSSVPGGPSPKKVGEDYEDDEGKYSKTNESEEIELDAEEDITEALENEIIEKLISEMEDEETAVTEQDETEAAEGEENVGEAEEDEGLDVDKKMEEMVNRLTDGSDDLSEVDTMKHTEGPEGEEQAGTGSMDTVVPPRKDRSNEGDKSKGTKPMDKGELADA